jgi:small GTP-binding protein
MVQIYINFIQDLKPKIAIIGYSGVGKTTFVNLVRSSEIPIKHLPSRNCDISTLKIGKLTFFIWDYTGKEQFRFLWEEFIKNSDAIILVTDSTIDNVNKSKFFLDIIKDNPTKPRIIAIANKQDLQNVIGDKQIEKILNLKTYPLKALDISNRDSMIQIIVDILNMRSEVSQQLEFLKEKEKLDNQLKNVLESKKYREAIYLIQNIMDLCLNLGDKALQNDYAKLKEKLTKDLKEEIKLKEDTNTHISPLVQHIEIQNKSNIKSQLRKLLNNYVQEVEGILMSIISDREGNLIIYENKDIDNNEFKSSDIIDISETILTKNKDEMASVLVVCPECQKRKKIQVPRKLIDEATNIITLSIPKKLVCEHNLQVYVDKNMMVRGYQRVDYEYDRYIDKIINEFSLKGDFCNIVTTENKKIAYCSKGPKSLLRACCNQSRINTGRH